MIQYADQEAENESLPLVRRNENGFAIPIFDETSNSNDQSGIFKVRASNFLFLSKCVSDNFNKFSVWVFTTRFANIFLLIGSGPVTHPLLTFRHSSDNGTGSISRSQRMNRSRRYQYLTVNPRTQNNPPGPVILQR